MRNWPIMNRRGRSGVSGNATALAAMLLAASLYGLAGAGPAAAQGTYYADLNAAVPDLASELAKNDRLAGKKVLVNVHDFFEERTGRNLPLSETLRQRFGTELATRGVQVFALPEGNEDDMVILQGVRRELPEAGVMPGSRKIDLVVNLIERTRDGQRMLPAARGRVDAVGEELLRPDLDSWGRHVVRELERRVGGSGRRVVHVRDIHLDGVAEPERFRRYVERRWLLPAFSQSRLFRLAADGGEGSEGALDVDVFVHDAGQVEIALNVWARGVQAASASIKMAQGLLPQHYIRGTETSGPGLGSVVTTPAPECEPTTEVETGVVQLLGECEGHKGGARWRQAWGCYGEVLERAAGNEAAQRGRDEIERGYRERMRKALARWDFVGARGVVEEFGRLEAGSERIQVRVVEWAEEIAQAKVFRDCEGCPELVVVPAGVYEMGSPDWEVGRNANEGPLHRVTIGEPLAVGVYEVTFEEWDACVSAGACYGYRPDDKGWGRGRRPVMNVSWEDAQAYVGWLSRKTGKGYRLLSESEWEYAARGGTTTPFHYGGTVSTGQANYDGDYTYGSGRKGENRREPVRVGGFSPNAFGLYDVHGNVWEWVEDCWHADYKGAPKDGSAWTRGGDCERWVLRGGSWYSPPWYLRSADRYGSTTGSRYGSFGFRVARTLTP